MVFRKMEADTLVADRTIRLYSQQWDLLWSDLALRWLLKAQALTKGAVTDNTTSASPIRQL